MRENSHPPEPHEEPVPPAVDTASGPHAAAGFSDPGNVLPPVGDTAAARLSAARRRTWIIWLLAGAMAIAAAVAVSAIVRKLQADHALSRVARVATVPPIDVATRDVPQTAAAGPTPNAGAMSDAGPYARTAAPPPNEAEAAPGHAAGAAGATIAAGATALLAQGAPPTAGRADGAAGPDKNAALGSAGRMGLADTAAGEPAAGAATNGVHAPQAVPPAPADAEERAGRAETRAAAAKGEATKGAMANDRLAKSGVARNGVAKDGLAKSDAAKKAAARRAARRAAGAGDTFKRCPPLGKKGAVMCRWHICNGAAGKEAACGPYLERAP